MNLYIQLILLKVDYLFFYDDIGVLGLEGEIYGSKLNLWYISDIRALN